MGARKPTRLVAVFMRSKKGNEEDSYLSCGCDSRASRRLKQPEVVENIGFGIITYKAGIPSHLSARSGH